MSTLSVLFRDSSAADGVRSRGAGWHSREVRGKSEAQRLERLGGELAEGDLVRSSGKTTRLLVHDGLGLRVVKPPNQRERDLHSDRSVGLSKELKGDWNAFWEATEDAEDLLWLAWRMGVERGLLVASACECAETSLRFVPEGEVSPPRAIRTTRRWLAGVASVEEMEAAQQDASQVAHAASRCSPCAASFAAATPHAHAAAAQAASAFAHAAATATFSASMRATRRSLTFLARIRIPSWKVCLAAARRDRT